MFVMVKAYHNSKQGARRPWKVMEFEIRIFQSWKINPMITAF